MPSTIINLDTLEMDSVPKNVYSFYSIFLSCNFLLIAIYAGYLFAFTDPIYLKTKIVFLWMVIAETSTFIDHFLRVFVLSKSYSGIQMIITLLIFAICLLWLINRACFKDSKEVFRTDKTYIVKFRPRNIFGIFNHIINLKGHSGIYQNGKIYKFRRNSGKIEATKISPDGINKENATLEEIKKKPFIKYDLLGKKFNLLKYNCNHLIKYAKKY